MHRARRVMATTPASSSSLTPHSSSKATHSRLPLGGNAAGSGSANNGALSPPTTNSTTTFAHTTSTKTVFTTSPNPISVIQAQGDVGGNGSGNAANAGLESTIGRSPHPATSSSLSGTFIHSTTLTTSSSASSPIGKAKSDTSIDLTGLTVSPGDSSVTTTSDSVPAQITSSTPTSSGPRRDMSSGIIAGIISVLIFCLLIIGVCIHRKRRSVQIKRETSESKVDGEVATAGVLTRPQFEESALVFTGSHTPTDNSYTPTPPSPRWLADSNSDISQLSLPPPSPTMVEIEEHPRAVPTLILDTSRYRRSPLLNPIDSRLSVITALSGDSHRISRGRHLSHDGSPTSGGARSWSPSEAFSLSKPPVSYHSSWSSSRPSSQTSLHVPPSPTNLRIPPSPSNLRGPPSPRTSPRTQIFIPPIPPLPKSPPPVPGSFTNPFVDRDPFDDPAG